MLRIAVGTALGGVIGYGAPEFDVLLHKLKASDVHATLEGWSKDKIGSTRHLTLSVRPATASRR